MEELDKLYHSPEGYTSEEGLWQLVKRKKLNKSHNITRTQVKQYYKSVAEVQRFKEPTKVKAFTHIIANSPNEIHQMDLIIMDNDRGYTSILGIVDVFSRYAGGAALKKKDAKTVMAGVKAIYDTDPLLKMPKKIMCDQGLEFVNEQFKQWLESNGCQLLANPTTDKRYTGIIERWNKTIERPIFLSQHTQELELIKKKAEAKYRTPRETNTYEMVSTWIDNLKQFIAAYNERPKRLLNGMTPTEAMEKPQDVVYIFPDKQDSLPPLPKYTPVKIVERDESKQLKLRWMRETYSNHTYYIRDILPGDMINPYRYILADEHQDILPASFYKEELQVIGEPKSDRNLQGFPEQPLEPIRLDGTFSKGPKRIPAIASPLLKNLPGFNQSDDLDEELPQAQPEPQGDRNLQGFQTPPRRRTAQLPARFRQDIMP
jgi:hypothetical protein